MVLPAVEHADESLKWCFIAERGAVNDSVNDKVGGGTGGLRRF